MSKVHAFLTVFSSAINFIHRDSTAALNRYEQKEYNTQCCRHDRSVFSSQTYSIYILVVVINSVTSVLRYIFYIFLLPSQRLYLTRIISVPSQISRAKCRMINDFIIERVNIQSRDVHRDLPVCLVISMWLLITTTATTMLIITLMVILCRNDWYCDNITILNICNW